MAASRGSTMAVACGVGIAAVLGGMYAFGRDAKAKEGQSSPYSTGGQGLGGTDKAMTSSDMNAAMSYSIPRPGSSSSDPRQLGKSVPAPKGDQ
ncbi:hypothetical protein D9613_010003 [Agrocybe pediades]|uniref:Uncharacterized protein n=1 Tax=Agrocybe pediades TaxID=84607 RepID=A0A8H4VQP0_9AGAR|nr:hypothetical protein D9613_010003 [Agrocybe pediades]KAF9567187.1 hypothetical protein CPC08DRAFT_703436 [Agrocybe pediades]